MSRQKSDAPDAPDHTLIVKIDQTTKESAQQVLQDTLDSARRNAPGARGSVIIAPTTTLKDGFTPKQLPSSPRGDAPRRARTAGVPFCKATKRDGSRCTALALEGNYGFCGRHRW
jgi:hypothetical protein